MAVLQMVPGTTVYIWRYLPNLPASIIFAVAYALIGGMIGWRMYKTKTWFVAAFVVGCVFEVIGYIGRAFSLDRTGQIAPFVIQATFILIPPAFFAATIYMILARIIHMLGADHLSIIKPTLVTKIFVTGDVLSFLVQGNASGLLVHDNLKTIGTVLVIVGLAIQLISFILFGFCAVIFHRRFLANPTAKSYTVDPGWRKTLWMMYAISVLIIIRSIFRIVEYVFGNEGYPLSHEWTLYVFDSVPMFVVCVLFFVWYPSKVEAKLRIKGGEEGEGMRLEERGSVKGSTGSVLDEERDGERV